MPSKYISGKYGLINDNLELKKNVTLEIDENGKISNITYEDFRHLISSSKEEENTVIIPGFINSHIHIGDSFAKEKGFNDSLRRVVSSPNGLKHRILRTYNKETKIEGIQNAVLEMLSNGITCFIDFREGGIEGINILKEALKDSPIIAYIFGRFHETDDIDPFLELTDGVGLASYSKISEPLKEALKRCRTEYKKHIACHIAEDLRKGSLIKQILTDNLVDIAIHGTHLTGDDLWEFRKNDIKLVLCPRCNGYFGVGFPPIKEILNLRYPISLGTDNVMVNNTDLFEEMRYFYRIARILSYDIELEATDLLKMVTINAAQNFGLEKDIGSIAVGKEANFFIVDLNSPNFHVYQLHRSVLDALIVQRTKPENIKKVYIKGELIFERK